MRNDLERPFDSIESALEFMTLLEAVVSEASDEVREKLDAAKTERYSNGLHLALYKLSQLSSHVHKSRRILNDLTLIRGVLTGDGTTAATEALATHTSA